MLLSPRVGQRWIFRSGLGYLGREKLILGIQIPGAVAEYWLVCAADAAKTGIAALRVVDCSDTSTDHPGLGYSDDMGAPLSLS